MNYSELELQAIFDELNAANTIRQVFEIIEHHWWGGDNAIEKILTPEGTLLTLHTFGWSDNEAIIGFMDNIQNFGPWIARTLTWTKIERGGHYTFLLPEKDVTLAKR